MPSDKEPSTSTGQLQPATASRRQVFMMISDPILENLYRSRFQSDEYCIVWCSIGDHWNQALLSFAYDVIVVDFSLFTSDPIENLMEIKRLSPEAEIIVLSESNDARIAIAAFQSGISDYFLKPTNPETLAWAIDRILRRREFTSSNEMLAADLRVFSAAHHVNMCESDLKMRELTTRQLIALLHAQGGIWVWKPDPSETRTPAEKKTEAEPPAFAHFRLESAKGKEEEGSTALKEFHGAFPEILDGSFESDLTSRPEQWFREAFAWIPLRARWMGGILIYGITSEKEAALAARIEFLVRNLEVSLENYRRFIEARQLTYIDELTGLYNSRYLDIAVTAAIDSFRNTNQGFSVLFIDVDRFKSVNDQHGHLVGSQLLIDVAHHLKKSLRKKDHLFRYGGDEFICLLYDISLEKAMEAAERIRADMERARFLIHNKELKVTLSIGVARFPDHSRDKDRILQMADEAMYSGKRSGRNAVFLAAVEPMKKAS